jgi:hypothetical protein
LAERSAVIFFHAPCASIGLSVIPFVETIISTADTVIIRRVVVTSVVVAVVRNPLELLLY